MKRISLGALLLFFITTEVLSEAPRPFLTTPGPKQHEASPAGRPLVISIRLYERDPNYPEHPARLVWRPTLMTLEHVPAYVAVRPTVIVDDGSGQRREVGVGRRVECQPSVVHENELRLAVKFSDTQLVGQSDERTEFKTHGAEVIATAELGKGLRLDLPGRDNGNVAWMVITVEEAKR